MAKSEIVCANPACAKPFMKENGAIKVARDHASQLLRNYFGRELKASEESGSFVTAGAIIDRYREAAVRLEPIEIGATGGEGNARLFIP